MTTRRPGRLGVLAGAAITLLLALPATDFATTSGPIAQTGGMTAELPLLGSSLKVEVTLDTAGNVSAVNLDPVGTFSASRLNSHAVTFDNTDGTAAVKVKAYGSKMAISASAGTLAGISGPGTWTANVFGAGTASNVSFTVGDDGTGMPTVVINSASAPGAGTATIQPMQTWKHDEHNDRKAAARVVYTLNGFTKTLTITASVDQERKLPARLTITLTGKDRQKLLGTLAQLSGDHTWTGQLCDGTAVGATFNVAADGTVTFVSASGAPATQSPIMKGKGHDHGDGKRGIGAGVIVRFDTTRTYVAAYLKPQGTDQYQLVLASNAGSCRGQAGPTPTTNSPVLPGATDPWTGHDGSHDGQPGSFNKDGGGHHD